MSFSLVLFEPGLGYPKTTLIPFSDVLWSERLRLDPTRRCVTLPEGKEIRLTNLEFRLLHLLMSRPGYVFPNEEIMQAVWGNRETDIAVLKNAIYRLRRKLEAEGLPGDTLIRTWPKGYSFQE